MYIRNSVGIINLEYNNNGVYQNNDHSVQRKKKAKLYTRLKQQRKLIIRKVHNIRNDNEKMKM